MPKAFDDCVNSLLKQGKSKDSAYAICVSQYKDKHGKSPFGKKEDILESKLPSEFKKFALAKFLAEQEGKKIKYIDEVTGGGVKLA